jgi:hypothetical protein
MDFHTYRFRLRTDAQIVFDQFPGVALRGALGRVMREIVCPKPSAPNCAVCPGLSCGYHRVFCPIRDDLPKRYRNPPPPFVLRPRFGAGSFSVGSALEFDLILAGTGIRDLPLLLAAINELGGHGMGAGRDRTASRGTFHIEQMDSLGPTSLQQVIAPGHDYIRPVVNPWRYPSDFQGEPPVSADAFCVELRTPTQLTETDPGRFPFDELITSLVRRLDLLAFAYGPGPVNTVEDYFAIRARAQEVRTAGRSLARLEVPRYSTRQQRCLQFAGWLGSVIYEGDVKPWLPLLKLAKLIHVGRHTAFGWGWISLREVL